MITNKSGFWRYTLDKQTNRKLPNFNFRLLKYKRSKMITHDSILQADFNRLYIIKQLALLYTVMQ